LIRLPKLAAALEEVRPGADVHWTTSITPVSICCRIGKKQHEVTGGSLQIEWEKLPSKFHSRHTAAQRRQCG